MTGDELNPFQHEPQREESLSPLFRTLSSQQQHRAVQLSQQLKLNSYENVLTFGAKTQEALANFSSRMLHHVQRKDVIKVGDILNELMAKLENIDLDVFTREKQGFLSRLFGKTPTSIQQAMTQFQRLSTQIDRLGIQLEYAQNSLLDDLSMLDELYELNNNYYEELTIYIAAGELKKKEALSEILPSIQRRATISEDLRVQQEAKDIEAMINSLDQRVYDLELSKQMSMQTAPQIRLIQQTNQQLAEKIQMSILTAIPLWKNQISMLLTMNNQRRASTAQRRMAQATNDMMDKKSKLAKHTANVTQLEQNRANSELLKLKNAQQALIEMIEETIELQSQGQEKRHEIEHAQMKVLNKS